MIVALGITSANAMFTGHLLQATESDGVSTEPDIGEAEG